MIKTVVFDLDGTLANTTAIHAWRRTPWDLLSPGVSGQKADRWAFRQNVCDLPGELILKGYRVGIAAHAPLAHASIAVHLLGIGTEVLFAMAVWLTGDEPCH